MNLLVDPVFRVQTAQSKAVLNLPALLEALGEDRVESLPGLQRHQEDAFHIFLCYLSGAILARAGLTSPHQSEEFWRRGIRMVTDRRDDRAWILVVANPKEPAFMQAPLDGDVSFNKFKPKASTPDELDILSTAKNHEIKSSRAERAHEEDWVFSLINLQGMSGFFGQGNYGTPRMNGGFGSRPRLRLEYSRRMGQNFCDDITRLLALRPKLLQGGWRYQDIGLLLLWTVPWDLKSSLPTAGLDPFFLEITRAVRMVSVEGGSCFALGAPSEAARVEAGALNGCLGDPWIPINRKKESALTVGGRGFTPELLSELIFERDYELQAMQRPVAGKESQSCDFHASVLVRGQGKTDGFHDVLVRIPAAIAGSLFRPCAIRDTLADRSKTALNDSGEMQNRVLKPALLSLLEAGPDQINFDKRELSDWIGRTLRRFGQSWSDDFFPWLWKSLDSPDPEGACREWRKALCDKAMVILKEAMLSFPARDGRRLRAQVRAEGVFIGCTYKIFPDVMEGIHGNE
jgi:CRISPR system Cascade subunit CasA